MRRRGGIRRAPRPLATHKYGARAAWVETVPPYRVTDEAALLAESSGCVGGLREPLAVARKRARALGQTRGWARCASTAEARRYRELLLLEAAGHIRGLRAQVPYALDVVSEDGEIVTVGTYVADYVYWQDLMEVVEDVKGVKTSLYTWKKKHVHAQYGIQILETKGPRI
jgi:hypothetical protein